ncbi:hypothetical protein HK405_014325, partial [Cladochytrium tenue]
MTVYASAAPRYRGAAPRPVSSLAALVSVRRAAVAAVLAVILLAFIDSSLASPTLDKSRGNVGPEALTDSHGSILSGLTIQRPVKVRPELHANAFGPIGSLFRRAAYLWDALEQSTSKKSSNLWDAVVEADLAVNADTTTASTGSTLAGTSTATTSNSAATGSSTSTSSGTSSSSTSTSSSSSHSFSTVGTVATVVT